MRRWAGIIFILGLAIGRPAVAETPLSFSASGHVVAPVGINGDDQHLFVIDTGAEGSAVYTRFAQAMKLESAGQERIVGQTGVASLPLRCIARLRIDGRTAGPITASELPDRPDGAVMGGIIGIDVIGRYLLDFDLSSARMALLDGAEARTLMASLGPATQARPVVGGLLAVPVQVNGVAGWGVVDTGARETRINTRFARLAAVEPDAAGANVVVHGATNNASLLRPGRARTVEILGQKLDDQAVRIADLPVFEAFGLEAEPAMIIGADYLGRFRLLIDFPTRRVWLR